MGVMGCNRVADTDVTSVGSHFFMNWSIKSSGPITSFFLAGPGVSDGAAGGTAIVTGVCSESYCALYSGSLTLATSLRAKHVFHPPQLDPNPPYLAHDKTLS